MHAEVVLRRRAENKTGWKKIHGPSIKGGTPSVLIFPRDPSRRRRASKAECLADLARYLDDRPGLAEHADRIKIEWPE